MLQEEVDELCAVVQHRTTTVVMSDYDCDTGCYGERVMLGALILACPLAYLLMQTDLANESFLLHPTCDGLFACLQHVHTHKQVSTFAVVVLPKLCGVWCKYLCNWAAASGSALLNCCLTPQCFSVNMVRNFTHPIQSDKNIRSYTQSCHNCSKQ